jgi:hypothetical protein
MKTRVSIFFFKECKAPLADGLMRFLVKSRAGIQFTPRRKFDILYQGSGFCQCEKIGSMKHLISCCPYRASLMTKRHNNVARIIAQAIESNNQRNLIKSETGQYIHWNQELRLPDIINNPKRNSEFSDRESSKRKLDIWYYTKVKKGLTTELKLNIVEVNIPWDDAIINPDKFEKNSDPSYIHVPFDSKDVQIIALAETRKKKIDKYDPIINLAKLGFKKIRIKHKLSNVNVDC